MSDDMRVDDLAREAGVATTTVRLYHSKGLLPPPKMEGRTGYYGRVHLDRLRSIARLQDDGFSLAGIKALIDRWEQGGDLQDLLGAHGHVDRILGAPTSQRLAADELLERFPAGALEPAEIQRAAALGLLQLCDDGSFLVPDTTSLETGAALVRMGVPLGAVLDEWVALTDATDALAERFADLFAEHLLPQEPLAAMDQATVDDLAETLVELKQRGVQILLAAFEASIRKVAAERFAELVTPQE